MLGCIAVKELMHSSTYFLKFIISFYPPCIFALNLYVVKKVEEQQSWKFKYEKSNDEKSIHVYTWTTQDSSFLFDLVPDSFTSVSDEKLKILDEKEKNLKKSQSSTFQQQHKEDGEQDSIFIFFNLYNK